MENEGFWTTGKIIVAVTLFLVLCIGGGIGGPILADYINSSTAPVTSKLQEQSQVYTAQNRISQYNLSYDEMRTYKADLESVYSNWQNINTFNKEYPPSAIASSAQGTGTLAELQQEDQAAVTGSQQICTQAAAQYNADGAKLETGATFRGVNLPKTVSLTACEKGNPN